MFIVMELKKSDQAYSRRTQQPFRFRMLLRLGSGHCSRISDRQDDPESAHSTTNDYVPQASND